MAEERWTWTRFMAEVERRCCLKRAKRLEQNGQLLTLADMANALSLYDIADLADESDRLVAELGYRPVEPTFELSLPRVKSRYRRRVDGS